MRSNSLGKITINHKIQADIFSFSASEEMSKISKYYVDTNSIRESAEDIVGGRVSIIFDHWKGPSARNIREFSGIITEVEERADEHKTTTSGTFMSLVIEPQIVFLSYSTSNSIYQKKSSIDIFKSILKKNRLNHLKIKTSARPSPREMCVQYNENDYDFCSRILAEDGIIFYYGDEKDPDAIILHDSANKFPKNSNGIAKFTDIIAGQNGYYQYQSARLGHFLHEGKISLSSHDIKAVSRRVSQQTSASKIKKNTVTLDMFEAHTEDKVSKRASIKAREGRSKDQFLILDCIHPNLHLGQEISVSDSKHRFLNGNYLIVKLETNAISTGLSVKIWATPLLNGYCPVAPKRPTIAGMHSAIVMGKRDGRPACDAQGRVQVKFFWDDNKDTKNTTAWLRVAQGFAGKGFGQQFIPRTGHEVIVSFLHGDPDCPIVVGSLFNEKAKYPNVKANSTESGIRTKGEGKPNEIWFDDKNKAQLLALRAGKNFELVVNEDSARTITKNELVKIGEDLTSEIKGNSSTKTNGKFDLESKQNITLSTKKSLQLDANEITLKANSKIKFTVGQSSIEISPAGISLKTTNLSLDGKMVAAKSAGNFAISMGLGKIESKGPLNLKGLILNAEGSVMAKLKGGAMTSVEASGIFMQKGALIKIN